MKAKEVATLLGVSARTVYDLPIPRLRIGRRVVWERADVDAYSSIHPTAVIPSHTSHNSGCARQHTTRTAMNRRFTAPTRPAGAGAVPAARSS